MTAHWRDVLLKAFYGRGGGHYDETSLSYCGLDLKPGGEVQVYSARGRDISEILKRSWEGVSKFRVVSGEEQEWDGVFFRIRSDVFRRVPFVLKPCSSRR